jgi:hypothetical protein
MQGKLWLTWPFTMLSLPSGTLTYFPKLEFLQIVYSHPIWFVHKRGDTDNPKLGVVAKTLSTFLTSERHPTLNRVEIGFWGGGMRVHDRGVNRFIATRCGSDWDVNVAKWETWALSRLDDMF